MITVKLGKYFTNKMKLCEIINWCDQNLSGTYKQSIDSTTEQYINNGYKTTYSGFIFEFENAKDAMMFKLTWS